VRDAGAPEDEGFRIVAEHFLTATDGWERAQYFHGGPEQREETADYFDGRQRVRAVQVEAVERLDGGAVVVTAQVTSRAEGRRLRLVLRRGALA
jgi:hypothetical protein